MRSRGCGPWGAWRGTEAPPDLRERTLPPGGERLPRGPHARGAFVSRPRAAPGGWGPRLETSEGRVSSEASLCGCVFTGHPAARVCAMRRALKGAARTPLNARLCQVAILGGQRRRLELPRLSALGQSPGVNPTSPPAPRPGPRKLLEHKKQELSGEMSGRRLSLSEALPHSLSLHLPITR